VGVDVGIGVSVGLSLLFVLYETAYPHTARLGRLKESSVYRNVKQYPEAQEYDGIVIMRFDAPLYFANSEYTREVSFDIFCFSFLSFIMWSHHFSPH
jgi:sulfate transporter 4